MRAALALLFPPRTRLILSGCIIVPPLLLLPGHIAGPAPAAVCACGLSSPAPAPGA